MVSSTDPKFDETSLSQLAEELGRDILAADFRFSLFVGALQSFKYETLLKPVHAQFKNSDGEVDVDRLRKLTLKLPNFQKLPNVESLDSELINMLKNVLLNSQHQLCSITLNELKEEVGLSLSLQTAPQWVFKIEYSSTRNQVWNKWCQSSASASSTFYAFHGSRFENFHSILNLGLHQHLNKTSLFGEGIYLSTEQSLSLHYSPCGEGWSKSQLGSELSVLALCEVINHPDVKRQGKTTRRESSVPEKYILVTNNELVRPRYLLVYTRPKSKTKLMAINFIQQNKFAIFLAFYASLLIGIGFAKKIMP